MRKASCLGSTNKRGTTLIELLVVIVVFLIGILAVVQIFPKGFQILVATRNNSVAAHLAEDEVERLSQHADQIPEAIIAVHYQGSPLVAVEDPTRNPYDLGPQGDSVMVKPWPNPTMAASPTNPNTAVLSLGGNDIGNWQLYSGPNSFRRVVGEGSRVPAPRPVGMNYGGLRLLNFGPADSNSSIGINGAPVSAYANNLVKETDLPVIPSGPVGTVPPVLGVTAIAGGATSSVGNCQLYDSPNTLSSSEYYAASFVTLPSGTSPLPVPISVNTASLSTAANASLLLPTNSLYNRTYHVRLAAYISSGGNVQRTDYPDLLVTVPQSTAQNAANNYYPLVAVPIQNILSSIGQISSGQTFVGADFDSIQVAPEYNLIANTATFTNDPLQFKLLDSNIGVLLFNPIAYSSFVEQPGGAREPLQARVDYDVYDWRILKQEFRLDNQQNLNGGNYGQFTLALQSIKVGTSSGPDGLANGPIIPIETAPSTSSATAAYQNNYAATQAANDDNFVLIDLQTGGVVYEVDPQSGSLIVTVNKSTGLVTVNSDGTAGGLSGYILIPGTTTATPINLAGRSLRVLYRARQEFAVNVLKASSYYAQVAPPSPITNLGQGQFCATTTGLNATVFNFPISDTHQQIVIDTINYTDTSGGMNIVHGITFTLEVPPTGGPNPQIDLSKVITNLNPSNPNITISGVKGTSMIVQALWNPDQLLFGANGPTNVTTAINNWEHGWRRNTNQTTIPTQELQ
jgi:type II secretory pathway pseudopilin PulG